MMRFGSYLLCLSFLFSLSYSVADDKGPAKGPNASQPSKTETAPVTNSGNEVPGLKLPAPGKVDSEESFVTVTAECKGTVKWLVLSTSVKLKYKIHKATPNEIDVGIPKYQSIITIFAIAQVDGKLTDFARTEILVDGPPTPAPPDPGPAPPKPVPDIKLPLHLSIIEDPANRTTEIGKIVTSAGLRAKFLPKKILMRVYTIKDEEIATKKFDELLKDNGTPLLILQDNSGRGLIVSKLPTTEDDVLKLVGPYVGGF